jgi:hypothetical protein
MSDLIERLREPSEFVEWFGSNGLFGEAANEIERLRAVETAAQDFIKNGNTEGRWFALYEALADE